MKLRLNVFLSGVLLLALAACGGGKDTPATGGATNVPTASAGPARTVSTGATVTLDGSGSRDTSGAALSYAWTLSTRPSGSSAALLAANTVAPSFVADVAGNYVAQLVVSNGTRSSAAVTVTISANLTNAAPSARAGTNQSVLVASTVTLDGSTSTDSDGDPLSYRWTLVATPTGSNAVLSSATSPRPTLVADLAGSYTATLVVNDGKIDSLSSIVTVLASAGNAAPLARAGVARTTVPGATVTLDGTASSDANNDVLSYRWTLSSRPSGSNAVLPNPTAAVTSWVPDVVGSYVATLVVNDGALDSAASTVAITVTTANIAPVANAGPAQNVGIGRTVLLDGGLSSDANGDSLSYQWSLTSRPAGSAAALTNRNSAQISFVADVEGLYVASLVVNDGRVDSLGSTVTVTATVIIPPLLAGTGTWAQERAGLAFHTLNATTGATLAQAGACLSFNAADPAPDGVVVASVANSTLLHQVDPLSGTCKALFHVAEPMVALAVAADGVVHLVSEASTAGARQLYRYAADGRLLSQRAVSGVSGLSGTADLTAPQGMDFAPDGTLVMTQGAALWRVNPVTGAGVLITTGLSTSGDFDMDAAGQLRSIALGRLNVYAAGTWTLLNSVALQRDLFAPSALVHR